MSDTQTRNPCPHKTLKKQMSGQQVWYVCECGQKFKAQLWDGKVRVVSPAGTGQPDAQELADLLCPPHASLDNNDKLEPFDNCIACIRVQRDELIELLKRISTDIAQTIIEDPIRAADGWVMMSQPILRDISATLEPYTNAASAVRDSVKGEGETAPKLTRFQCDCGRTLLVEGQVIGKNANDPPATAPEELARSREKWVEIAKNLLWDSVVLQPAIMDFDEVVAQMADYMQSGYAALLRPRLERAERWIPVGEQDAPKDAQFLAYDANQSWVGVAWWKSGFGRFVYTGGQPLWQFTHWHPLPSAPDTEKET